MQVFQGQYYLSNDESGSVLIQLLPYCDEFG
jgi:hypothetical protein